MAIVEIRNLRKEYGSDEYKVTALDGVDVSIEKGEFVAVVGSSGSGKTTLLNMMGGLDDPSEGAIVINGQRMWVLYFKTIILLLTLMFMRTLCYLFLRTVSRLMLSILMK